MIEVKNLNKTFKVTRRDDGRLSALKALFKKQYININALQDVSFNIKEGEMVGYIGPNGAGKSTTIKILSGVLMPDSGTCVINGRVPWKERIAHVKEIGVVFGQRSQLWWDIPVIDSFNLLRDIYKVPEKEYKENLKMVTDLLDIEKIIKTPTRQLSLGQRMRCEISASLLHSPKILFLDEPTIGLDAVSKRAVREFISNINREKKTTLILTTHDMQDIEALTNRIILIGKGRILLDGSISDLKEKYNNKKTLSIEYSGQVPKSFVRFIPIVFIASILPEPFRLKAPEHPEQFLAFLISMLLAFLLVVAFCMLIYITTFYTLSPMGIRMVMSSLVEFLAGGVIPLPFFPDAIRKIINFIPFASMQNTPYRIYSGNINGMGAVYSILLQLFWTIVLVVGGKLLIKKALKRIVVQGG